jgi:hopanoid biosynthesis associated protein HpnK
MPLELIINADDFGLTKGVNRSIVELHQAGVLTSATLMATGDAFEDAVTLARAHPTLGIGCHVVLTDGTPASEPSLIPSLLGPDGRRFRSSLLNFVRALLLGRIREEEIEIEARAQMRRIKDAGIVLTHADTHKHTHLFPQVTKPLLRAMQLESVHGIRNPFEPTFTQHLGHAALKRRAQVTLLNRFLPAFRRQTQILDRSILTTNGTVGISATGSLNASTLTELLAVLPDHGTFELVCHPGYNDTDLDRVATRLRSHREIEMQALLSCIPESLLQPNRPTLISFGRLSSLPRQVSL